MGIFLFLITTPIIFVVYVCLRDKIIDWIDRKVIYDRKLSTVLYRIIAGAIFVNWLFVLLGCMGVDWRFISSSLVPVISSSLVPVTIVATMVIPPVIITFIAEKLGAKGKLLFFMDLMKILIWVLSIPSCLIVYEGLESGVLPFILNGNIKILYITFILYVLLILTLFICIPIFIAEKRGIKGKNLSIIKVLSWLGIFGGFTWIAAFMVSLAWKASDNVEYIQLEMWIKLRNLKKLGIITEEEFEDLKANLLE